MTTASIFVGSVQKELAEERRADLLRGRDEPFGLGAEEIKSIGKSSEKEERGRPPHQPPQEEWIMIEKDGQQRRVPHLPEGKGLSIPKRIQSDLRGFKRMVAERLALIEPFDLPFFIGRAEVMAEVVRRGEVPSVHGKRPITAVQLVWSDPALALAVSARASARYGPRPLGEAIRLVGETAIRRRILPAMLQRTEYFQGLRHAVSTLYFQQSLTRAYLAYELAQPHGARVAENAYQAALLLHLGKQALLVVLHVLSGSPLIPATAEINRFLERYHPKVGAMLTERFGCLPQVSEALRQQREKLGATPAPTLSKIVQLAERIRRREVLTEDVLLSEGMMDQICAVAGSLPPLREHIERRLSPLLNPTSTRASGG